MKIALVLDGLGIGGAERQALLCAAELKSLGHSVDIVIFHPIIKFRNYVVDKGLNLVIINKKRFFRFARVPSLTKLIRDGDYDVVHAFKGYASIYTSIAGRLAGAARTFGGHRGQFSENIFFRTAYRIADRFLTGWIVNSYSIRETMAIQLGINREKLSVVYNGISSDDFSSNLSKKAAKAILNIEEKERVVTMIARLHQGKNHIMFLNMASLVISNIPDVCFLVVGDGPYERSVRQEAASLGVSDKVLFLGQRTDIPVILAATDVAVLTSNSEGFPNSLIEPMSVGVPVVSTDYEGVHEIIEDEHNGLVVPVGSARAMAERVINLLGDGELSKKIGAQGKRTVERFFNTKIMVEKLLSVYTGEESSKENGQAPSSINGADRHAADESD